MKLPALLFMVMFVSMSHAQDPLDSVLSSLRDEDLEISFVVPGNPEWLLQSEEEGDSLKIKNKKRKINLQRNIYISSFTLLSFSEGYSFDSIVQKLYRMLDNESSDLYAHALLNELFFPVRLFSIDRLRDGNWILDGRKAKIKREWKFFLEKEGYLVK